MAIQLIRVSYFFRKPLRRYNSIEGTFSTIIDRLPSNVAAQSFQVPHESSSIGNLVRNCLFARKHQASINHITGDIHYIALSLSSNTILTVHDTSSALRGHPAKRLVISLLWFWLPAIRVSRITVISEFTKNQLEHIIPFAKHKIVIIPNPTDPALKYTPKHFNKTKPTILHIGTKPNKNLERTIIALENIPCRLIVVGELTNTQQKLLRLRKIDFYNEFNISRAQIINNYSRCDLVSFASTYEGFGLPIIESNAIGRPIIAGNVGAIPEVANNAACLVDPYSTTDIRNGILRVINDGSYRNQLIQNGLINAMRYNIDLIVAQYTNLYLEVLGETHP